MTIPPESIEVGKCYLSNDGRVRRAAKFLPDGRVQFEGRMGHQRNAGAWRSGMQDIRSFAFLIEREVPCDWTGEDEP